VPFVQEDPKLMPLTTLQFRRIFFLSLALGLFSSAHFSRVFGFICGFGEDVTLFEDIEDQANLSEKERELLPHVLRKHSILPEKIFGVDRPDWTPRGLPVKDAEDRLMAVFRMSDNEVTFTICVYHNKHGWDSDLTWTDDVTT
ncbi:MAG TPA: hypothetical protein VJK53_04825, partial [Candidatus Paceibacterota bacterium]